MQLKTELQFSTEKIKRLIEQSKLAKPYTQDDKRIFCVGRRI